MTEEMLKFFIKKGFLLDRELLEFFSRINDLGFSEDVLNKIVILSKGRVITRAILASYLREIRPMFIQLKDEKQKIASNFLQELESDSLVKVKKEEPKKEIVKLQPSVKILSSNIIPYRKIEVKDFITHFKLRYGFLRDILRERKELTNLVSVDKIGSNRDFSIIALVTGKRITKNKNLLLELEDLTGRATALVVSGKEELFNKAKEIMLDDVIGFKCSGGREILYVNGLFFPDSYIPEKKKTEEEEYVLFVSDVHVGSKMFLEENFMKFIDWLNEKGVEEGMKDKIDKIKYLFFTGDNVEGVGINPGQEPLLAIKDMKDQYKELARYLKMIPPHIKIIMCAGQHDAVRVPEPQPPLDEEFAAEICAMENVYIVSNPAFVEIGGNGRSGFKVLMYHGASMHSWIDEIEDLRLGKANLNPSKVVKYMLRHRHLSPMHSGTTYVPGDKEDSLVIKEAPDVVATGDMHRTDVDMYNNTLIICGSCWQSTTPFEEKVGNVPDPCKVPMLNLKTREIKILDFS